MPQKKESRNGHAFHPIMRKGGVHEKSNKAKRKAERQQVDRNVKDWQGKKAADDSAAFLLHAVKNHPVIDCQSTPAH